MRRRHTEEEAADSKAASIRLHPDSKAASIRRHIEEEAAEEEESAEEEEEAAYRGGGCGFKSCIRLGRCIFIMNAIVSKHGIAKP